MLFNIGSSEGGGAAIWMPAAVAVANHWLAHRATIQYHAIQYKAIP